MSQDVWIVAPPAETEDVADWLFALGESDELPSLGTRDEVLERLQVTWTALGGPDETGPDDGLPSGLGAVDLAEGDGEVWNVAIDGSADVAALVWHLNRRYGTDWRVVDLDAGVELLLEERDPFAR